MTPFLEKRSYLTFKPNLFLKEFDDTWFNMFVYYILQCFCNFKMTHQGIAIHQLETSATLKSFSSVKEVIGVVCVCVKHSGHCGM